MKKLVIYVHGKGGTAEEAKHYQPLFAESDVIGFDYKSQYPWQSQHNKRGLREKAILRYL